MLKSLEWFIQMIDKLQGSGIAVRIIEMSLKDIDLLNSYLSDYISKQEAIACLDLRQLVRMIFYSEIFI